MDANVISAIIAAVTTLGVLFVTSGIQQRIGKKQDEKRINEEYLNPLRLYLEETYFRVAEIVRWVDAGGGRFEFLLCINSSEELSQKDASWFNGEGCYFVSSCYFAACLFATIKKVRDDVPYLGLRKGDDTQLLQLLLKINLGFLKDMGVFYAIQQSIGEQMYMRAEKRFMTYREFCEALQDPQVRIWFDRLLHFFLDTGKGRSLDRVGYVLEAIYHASTFLDKKVGGGPSIKERLRGEGVTDISTYSGLHTPEISHDKGQQMKQP
jgi:hypothetical protein